ncbi:MAG TPA: NHLP family bacteriocin export ABC transporter peptidase/permease/ATPase subunit [Candidatus Cybelea sp.]|jgi:NHLM bacteriocin system ABC transporter peptidase/ATP-binding protein|nr:NHLP family bacteriocin export ABC transporter peptidase/permease/ATPase subunit [Candidatus Cybelea sp.]
MKLLERKPRSNGEPESGSPKAGEYPKPVRTPTVLQMEAVECGAASLGMILGYYGKHVPLEELRVACGVTRDGSSAGNLLRAARAYGLQAHGFKYDIDDLRELKPPFIVFWLFYHFVVVEGFTKDGAMLNDPAGGRRLCDWEEFDRAYTGVCLTFETTPEFKPSNEVPATTSILRAQLAGSWGAVLFVILAGLMLVIPNIALPTFTKTFIDEVLIGRSYGWVLWIVLGIVGSIVLQVFLLELEQYAIVRLQAKIALANASRMLWHVMHLPMTFFAQRSPAEVANRVAICDRVAELLSSRLAASAIGVIAALFYLALMARYDRFLALVSLGIAGLNILALRIVARRRSDANAALLQEEAMLLGSSVSGLERIETLKAGGAESTFFMKWLGHQARVINARQRFAAPSQILNAVPRFLVTINVTAILALGGLRVIEGAISIGTLFAYALLMQLFIAPFTTFVELGADVQEMDGDVRRIEDVMRYPPEAPRDIARVERVRLAGELELRNVSFGYNKHGPPAIKDISFVIAPGRRVALVGPSGSGKSTIAKLVSGLFVPWSGSVLFDGFEREAIDPSLFGSDVAFVDQEISLYPGTIRSNLTLWDPAVPDAAIERAARDACIHADIVGRPEGYDALMAEGGVNFSGGQRQRLEIARAMVRDPALVILDEATSALDPLTEYLIDESLRRRGCACLIVAHRLSTIRDADEIIVLDGGVIAERGTHDQLIAREGRYLKLVRSQ